MATFPDKRTCPLLTVNKITLTNKCVKDSLQCRARHQQLANKDVINVALHCNPHSDSQYNCSPTLRLLSHVAIMCTILVMMEYARWRGATAKFKFCQYFLLRIVVKSPNVKTANISGYSVYCVKRFVSFGHKASY